MSMKQTRDSSKPTIGLMSARTAKRWGRWFVFVWLAMWVSTALLPCGEVEAAFASQKQIAHSDCGHPVGGVLDSSGSQKRRPCLNITMSAPASAAGLAAAGGNPVTLTVIASASSNVLSSHLGLSFPIAYRAAPPPVAVYMRSLRLRI